MLTKQQLEERRFGIGSSEIAAIVGKSPYATPMTVFRAKVDGESVVENDAMAAGSYYEDGIAKFYAARQGVRLSAKPPTLKHPTCPWALATVDRFAVVGRARKPYRVVEIKNVQSAFSADAWGAEGTDQVPEQYLLQVIWQLEIAHAHYGVDEAHVVAAFFGRAPRVYPIRRDPELGGLLLEAARKFWFEHVVTGVAPALDDSDDTQKYLRQRFPRSNGILAPASVDSQRWFRRWVEADQALKDAEQRKGEAQAYLQLEIADRDGIAGPLGKATWKPRTSRIDWEACARAHGATDQTAEAHRPATGRTFRMYPEDDVGGEI
jgi:putative phage-type endonuclease